MSAEMIYLDSRPMPYMTECSLKRFNINEYHCARYSKHFVLIFMMHNQLTFEEDGIPVTLRAGEWYIQRKGMRQSASAPSPAAEYLYIHFSGELAADKYRSLALPIRGEYEESTFDAPLKELHLCANRTPPDPFEIQQHFIGLMRMLSHTLAMAETPALSMVRYIDTHYFCRITSQTLSEKFSYSTEYIERQVKAAIGMTPHAYLTQRRLFHARRQLERSSLTIAQVSEGCGFSDISLFFRAFKKEYGVSPAAWRKSTVAFPAGES